MNGRKQCEPFELNGGILHAYGRCKQHTDERKNVLVDERHNILDILRKLVI